MWTGGEMEWVMEKLNRVLEDEGKGGRWEDILCRGGSKQ